MKLTSQYIIRSTNKHYPQLLDACRKSKIIYNCATYYVRQTYFNDRKFDHSLGRLYRVFKSNEELDSIYQLLPAKVSQQTMKLVDESWKSYKGLTKRYFTKKDIHKPKLPKYIKNDVYVTQYTNQCISKREFKKTHSLKLSGIDKVKISLIDDIKEFEQIRIARVIPKNNRIIVEVVYEKDVEQNSTLRKTNVLGIDPGLNNLCTCTSNIDVPFIINGKPLKSINQFYNKEKARLQSALPKDIFWSKNLSRLTNKRHDKIKDYLHKSSRRLIDYCVTNNIGRIIIGRNKGWKQNINLGKKTNQNFVNIPFSIFISMLQYKAKLVGIEVILQEEAYTSKCSFLDHERICKHKSYKGKRVKRGLFRANDGTLINADVNGSYNIIEKWRRKNKKVVPNLYPKRDGIEDFVVSPLRKTIDLNW